MLEKLTPEQYKEFNELHSANVVEAVANMERFNAVFFEHWTSASEFVRLPLTYVFCACFSSFAQLIEAC